MSLIRNTRKTACIRIWHRALSKVPLRSTRIWKWTRQANPAYCNFLNQPYVKDLVCNVPFQYSPWHVNPAFEYCNLELVIVPIANFMNYLRAELKRILFKGIDESHCRTSHDVTEMLMKHFKIIIYPFIYI